MDHALDEGASAILRYVDTDPSRPARVQSWTREYSWPDGKTCILAGPREGLTYCARNSRQAGLPYTYSIGIPFASPPSDGWLARCGSTPPWSQLSSEAKQDLKDNCSIAHRATSRTKSGATVPASSSLTIHNQPLHRHKGQRRGGGHHARPTFRIFGHGVGSGYFTAFGALSIHTLSQSSAIPMYTS